MLSNIVCPISAEKIDVNVSRLTVFFNLILMVAFLITLEPIIIYIVLIDYSIRATGNNHYSPLCILASNIIRRMPLKPTMKDKAPKIFASRLGVVCAALGAIFLALDMVLASRIIIGIFAVLTFSDAVFNFCVGCLIYNYLVFPFYNRKN